MWSVLINADGQLIPAGVDMFDADDTDHYDWRCNSGRLIARVCRVFVIVS